MAITATEATVWHTAPANSLNYRMSRSSTGEIQMRKISVFAIAAAVPPGMWLEFGVARSPVT
jgi:hypothetical protein